MIPIICTLLNVYLIVVIAMCVLSFFPLSPDGFMGQVQRVLRALTEPILGPLRSVLPPVRMGAAALDLSPMVLLFGIFILQAFLCS